MTTFFRFFAIFFILIFLSETRFAMHVSSLKFREMSILLLPQKFKISL